MTKLSETTKELLNNCQFSILTYQRGGDAEGAKPATDPQAIMTRSINFPAIVATNPVPYAITVSGYNSLLKLIFNQQQIEALNKRWETTHILCCYFRRSATTSQKSWLTKMRL